MLPCQQPGRKRAPCFHMSMSNKTAEYLRQEWVSGRLHDGVSPPETGSCSSVNGGSRVDGHRGLGGGWCPDVADGGGLLM